MHFRTATFALLIGIASIANANAQPVARQVPLPPKPDFSSLHYFLGSWDCTTRNPRRPIASHGGVRYTIDSTGYFLGQEELHRATPWYPHDHTGTDRIAYDASAKRWVDLWTESDGGFGVLASVGWTGSKLTWSDVTPLARGDSSHDRDYKITRVNANTYSTATSISTGGQTAIPIRGICTRKA